MPRAVQVGERSDAGWSGPGVLIALALLLVGCGSSDPEQRQPRFAPADYRPGEVRHPIRLGDSGWHLPAVQAEAAWLAGGDAGQRSVVVAVIDLGWRLDHPGWGVNTWSNPHERPNGKDDDGNGQIDDIRGWDFIDWDNDVQTDVSADTHGLGVAAMIGDPIHGIAPGVTVLPVRAAGRHIPEAIRYAVWHGAEVLNISLVVDWTQAELVESVAWAREQGAVVVSSAGNAGRTIAEATPVILVGALDEELNLAGFSNRGPGVDIYAPGDQVWTGSVVEYRTAVVDWGPAFDYIDQPFVGDPYVSSPIYALGYEQLDGTSYAAPLVCGAIALLMGHRGIDAQAAAELVLTNAVPLADGSGRTRLDLGWLVGAGPQ